MTPPPADDRPTDGDDQLTDGDDQLTDGDDQLTDGDDQLTDGDDQPTDTRSESDRADDAIEPPTQTVDSVESTQPPAASDTVSTAPTTHSSSETSAAAGEAAVDSKWWYAVAAVPLYVLVGIVGGVFAVALFVFGIAVDVGGGMGLATGLIVVLLTLGVIGYALAGLALSILFPAGIYLDAKAVAAADVAWEPDAVLYLLVAAASVVLSAFTLSAVVALYYLYRRNSAVGVP